MRSFVFYVVRSSGEDMSIIFVNFRREWKIRCTYGESEIMYRRDSVEWFFLFFIFYFLS